MKWLIYYGDGSIYRDCDGSPFDAPARDVQVIAIEDEAAGQVYVHSVDYYWWTGDGWQGGDLFGLYDHLIEPGPKRVLFGRSLTIPEWRAVLARAHGNDYLPPKSAYYTAERRES